MASRRRHRRTRRLSRGRVDDVAPMAWRRTPHATFLLGLGRVPQLLAAVHISVRGVERVAREGLPRLRFVWDHLSSLCEIHRSSRGVAVLTESSWRRVDGVEGMIHALQRTGSSVTLSRI